TLPRSPECAEVSCADCVGPTLTSTTAGCRSDVALYRLDTASSRPHQSPTKLASLTLMRRQLQHSKRSELKARRSLAPKVATCSRPSAFSVSSDGERSIRKW